MSLPHQLQKERYFTPNKYKDSGNHGWYRQELGGFAVHI